MRSNLTTATLLLAIGLTSLPGRVADAQNPPTSPKPADTERWEPVPPVVRVPPTAGIVPAPADAIVLFDGTNLDQWVNASDGAPAGWTVADGLVTVNKRAGDIRTRRSFANYQMHLEWRVPIDVTGRDQARGNSGLYLASGDGGIGYELQILDSFENATYVNGMAGSIYKQSIPLANPTRPPGAWNVYDVIWTAPTFNTDGSVRTRARVTVLFNGVLVQHDFELPGSTQYTGAPTYTAHGPLPILLQSHGDPSPPISFRNIWLRELP